MLKSVTTDRWLYFFDECLPVDVTLLGELNDTRIAERWCGLVDEFPRARDTTPTNKSAAKLLEATRKGDLNEVKSSSQAMLASMR